MRERITRRNFIRALGTAGAGLYGLQLVGCGAAATPTGPKALKQSALAKGLAVASGDDPRALTIAAINALGGMKKLVSQGDVVVVKPNIGWDRRPEQAANTNPDVVAALIELCLQAGAKEVKVFDRTCNDPRRSYDRSGIADMARRAGAKVSQINPRKFNDIAFPKARLTKSWPLYGDVLTADVLINVAIAKHHSTSRLTMGMKNMMGIAGGDRGTWHTEIHQRIADVTSVAGVDLTVLDANRILLANGPQGGSLEDVKEVGQVIAGTDPVAVDACGATLFDLEPSDIGHVVMAHEMGLGEMDLGKVHIERISIG